MEVMSSLLLCALLTLTTQTSARKTYRTSNSEFIKFNNSLLIHQKSALLRKKLLLNINGPPLVNKVSELQSVFIDIACRSCYSCMERAVKAYKYNRRFLNSHPYSDEMQYELVSNEISRFKRDTAFKYLDGKIVKKSRNQRNKGRKSVIVTKYNKDDVIYALKVREKLSDDDFTTISLCQVYSIKKSFPCDTPEGKSLLSAAKRKTSKKIKREKEKKSIMSLTDGAQTNSEGTLPSRKREVDNTQLPENVMPSMEDFY